MTGVLNIPAPDFLAGEEFVLFEDSVDRFVRDVVPPETMRRFRANGVVDRSAWSRAAQQGLLGVSIPEEYGGAGGDFRHEAIILRQFGLHGLDGWGLPLHNAIVAPYLLHYGTRAQKQRWLPRMCSGDLVGAIAMTEPGAGSDLQAIRSTAVREGDSYVINGSKTFITNGQTADLIIVVAKTDPSARARGISLLVVESGQAEGFRRGRNLEKLGLEAGDTSELFFDDVRVPAENLIGGIEGRGFYQLMEQLPQERLIIALESMATIERALAATIEYTKQRSIFGKPVIEFQNSQFKLAECKTEGTIAKVFANHCVDALVSGRLDAATASMAKYWITDLACKIVDECLQLHGGYGYMSEYPISEMFKDARVKRIYGGANEVMKMLIGRSL